MPGNVLTTNSKIKCPHRGTAILITANTRLSVDNALALLESDVHQVMGCQFTVGSNYSPCVRIEWTAGAAKMRSGEIKVLIRSSVGKCYNAQGAPQGIAIIKRTQTKTKAI